MMLHELGIAAISQAALLLGVLLAGVDVVRADNPIVQTIYTTDPAPMLYNGSVYVFTGHDENGSKTFNMLNWHVYSTTDMVNWQDLGSPMSLATFSWANANAWAGQVIERNNKFYYYVPVRHNNGQMAIGVGVSNTIAGPYVDALGKPLVETNEIDPTVFIDDDNQAYLYWGNPDLYYVKLNQDMISYSTGPTKIALTTAGFGTRTGNAQRATTFEEAPWVYKRNGIYYLVYAANCCSEDIRYSTGTSALGPWTYRGVIMPTQGSSFTNHLGIIDYKGNSYFFYHNGALPGGGGYTRSVAVERFVYNADGTIPTIQMTTAGVPQIGTLNPYIRQEAETIAFSSGLTTETCGEGGFDVSSINNGDYIKVKGVAFGSGASSFTARVSSANSGGKIELHVGGLSGTLVGTCSVPGTGGWQTWTSVTCPVSGATGTQDLYFKFTGSGTGFLFNFNWWQFGSGSGAQPTTTTAVATTATTSTTLSTAVSSSSIKSSTTTSTSSGGCTAKLYDQCAGDSSFKGCTTCPAGSTCKYSNPFYSQCL